MPSRTFNSAAFLMLASIASFSLAQTAVAAGEQNASPAVQKTKSKQCVTIYSPRYKTLRIKPIQISYRWCSKANPTDCTKWESDTVADIGKSFTVLGYCFTHRIPVFMDLQYNKKFGDSRNPGRVKIQPHAMKLKDNLAPHPFCGSKSAHRFVMKGEVASYYAGKPRAAVKPKCTWHPIKKNAKAAS